MVRPEPINYANERVCLEFFCEVASEGAGAQSARMPWERVTQRLVPDFPRHSDYKHTRTSWSTVCCLDRCFSMFFVRYGTLNVFLNKTRIDRSGTPIIGVLETNHVFVYVSHWCLYAFSSRCLVICLLCLFVYICVLSWIVSHVPVGFL